MVTARVNPARVNRAFRKLPERLTASTRKAIRKGGLMIRATATVSLRQPGKGRLYIRGAVRHRASAPGDPPASDTGRLLGSIEMVLLDGGLAAEIGTALDYGRFLEFGTSKMAARPFLRPAWERHRKQIVNDVANEMNKALRRRSTR